MSDIARFLIGCLGGMAAALSKVLAIDIGQFAAFLKAADATGVDELRVTILIFTPILMVLGGIVGWVSGESHRVKLLAIGCSAPALLAPWTAGQLSSAAQPLVAAITVSSVHAQSEPSEPKENDFVTGLSVLLGLKSVETQHYWVVVGSETNIAGAMAYAEEINRHAPELDAFVGSKMPGNDYYAVIVGGPEAYLPYKEAEALRRKAVAEGVVNSSAYLSAYPDRTPVQ